MKRFTPSLALACLVFLHPTVDSGDKAADDLMRIQGTWEVYESISMKQIGSLREAKFVFSGNKLKVTQVKDTEDREFAFELDPSHNPKHLDLKMLTGPHKGTKGLGLYRLHHDTLALAVPNQPNNVRPTGFNPYDGNDLFVLYLKRVPSK